MSKRCLQKLEQFIISDTDDFPCAYWIAKQLWITIMETRLTVAKSYERILVANSVKFCPGSLTITRN